MGEIKSALEIALERTRDVKADKAAVEADKFIKEGKKIVSVFLNEPEGKLDGVFSDFEAGQLGWVREGMFQALMLNFSLPVDEAAKDRAMKAARGFYKLIDNSKALNTLFKQVENLFQEYLGQRKMVRESLEQQFAPRLRQKQEQLARQMGGSFKLDPSADPEFMKYLKQTLGQLEEQYTGVLGQVREELQQMFKASA